MVDSRVTEQVSPPIGDGNHNFRDPDDSPASAHDPPTGSRRGGGRGTYRWPSTGWIFGGQGPRLPVPHERGSSL
jgi:hypothetical protein